MKYRLEALFTLVGTPHHLLAQGMEILGTSALDDPHAIRCLANGQASGLRQVLRTSVKGYQEIVRPALHRQFDL